MDAKLDHFVSDVGGCGLFQTILCFCVFGARGCAVWCVMFMVYGGYDPGWVCDDDDNDSHSNTTSEPVPTTTWATKSTPVSTSSFLSQVANNDTLTSSSKQTCDQATSCRSPLRFNPESSTLITEWSLVCDKDWIPPIILSLQMVGMFFGSLLCGPLGERLGRKVSLYTWVALGVITNVIAGFSTSWKMLATVRFFVGMAAGGNLSISQMFPSEFTSGIWRARVMGFPSWNISSVILGVFLLLLRDWRYVHFATAGFSAIVLLTVFWLPESLRWLAVHGKSAEAKNVALKICSYNRKPRPDDHVVNFSECEGKSEDKKPTVLTLFRGSLMRKTVLTSALIFMLTPTYYAIGFGIKALHGNFYVNFLIFSLLPIPLTPLIPYLGNKIGRRWATAAFIILASAFAFVIVIIELTVVQDSRGYVVTSLAIIMSCLIDLGYSLLLAFLAELYPTSVRAMGFAFAMTCGRLGSILAPYLIPKRKDLLYASYSVLGVLTCVCCGVVLALPETLNKGLQEVIQVERKTRSIENCSDKNRQVRREVNPLML